ncbi:beta-lactamase class A [Chitinophaga ginsengisegetis]|uniref:Beta-lactamase n=1 Tax=Chitinophaga ginsengisegetis TaxID=393003 RepID=A0A1T5PCG6_9BACT|nr:class A beta-lactamase [Chitinophaga ginsengisegetis]SKD10332.1 beta-lactamase class A [Chitinophaga ginsengisegetis]
MRKPVAMFITATMAVSVACLPTAKGQQTLRQQIAGIAGNISGKVGVYAEILETKDTVSFNRDQHFPMQSVYKFPIAMAMLHQVDQHKFRLDQPIHVTKDDLIGPRGVSPVRDQHPEGNFDMPLGELIDYNIRASDGSACDVLLRLLGGTAKANAYVHSLGVKQLAISTTEKVQVPSEMIQYKNWSTPMAMTQLLKIFYQEPVLSDSSKNYLMHLMVTSRPGAKRLKGLLPAGTVVAHKTGTSWTTDGLTRATNDVGIITLPNGHHLAITVFVSDAKASEEEREGAIAKIAKAAYDHWSK